ncbi:MAG: hypothetical protein JWM52_317 [Candidatus Saccharibacteria bacterium]|nr:hypothetical protein [Candidatus Saccharibacteria bacterium]
MDFDIHEKVQSFFETYPKRTYPKDQIMIFGGESPEKVFYMISGKISQYDISYRGDEIVINIYKSPAFFPMVWAMNKIPNRYFFKADEVSEVHMAPADDVVAFIKQNPDVMFNLVSRLYKGIDSLLERTVYLMSGSARSRIMYELVIEANRFGTKIAENCYEIHISESDLGSHVGLARETVSREVKRLKDKGLVEVVAGNIILKDLASLKEQLGQVA